jgi:hypothetical protein
VTIGFHPLPGTDGPDAVRSPRARVERGTLHGEKMARLCAEFGLSRKTGYKISHRYKACGIEGLTDRSRRPQQPGHKPEPLVHDVTLLRRGLKCHPCLRNEVLPFSREAHNARIRRFGGARNTNT